APGLGDDGNTYHCVVSGDCVEATSNTVTLKIEATLKITGQPQNTQICEGSDFDFEVKFKDIVSTCTWEYDDGSGYQAISSHTAISMAAFTPGDVSNVLTIDPSTYSMDGWKFRALINGTEYSNVAQVKVYQKVLFADISDETLCIGAGKSFNVNVTAGTEPLSYEWKRETTGLGTGSSLNLDAAALDGTYSISVTNALCPSLTKNFDISRHPDLVLPDLANASPLCIGAEINLSAIPTSGPVLPVTYTWTQDGNSIGSNETYNKTNVSPLESGIYKVVVKDYCTSKTSSISITVLDAISLVAVSPDTRSLCEGESLDLQVNGSGLNLEYNWSKIDGLGGSITVPNLSSDELLHFDALSSANAGYYRCVLSSTDNCNTDVQEFTVNVLEDATVSLLEDIIVCQDVLPVSKFTVIGTGENPVLHQWYKNDVEMPGEESASLLVNNDLTNNGNNYHVVVRGGTCKSVESNKALLTVNENVSITTQPVDVSVSDVATEPVIFTVAASGGLTYQWFEKTTAVGADFVSMGNSPVSAQTNALILSSVGLASDGYEYRCEVIGICLPAESNPAKLNVNATLKITGQPQNTQICEGSDF
ncbi:hypothetical protein ACXR6G_20060, partial [Ancylomarina sp. YFZ004]